MSALSPEEIRLMRERALKYRATEFWTLAHEIADIFGVKISEITAPTRGSPRAVEARHWICRTARSRGFTLERVGEFIGRDHTSIMNSVQRAEIMEAQMPAPMFKSMRAL
jgi:chromosomal replication initiation ATPase DnaA